VGLSSISAEHRKAELGFWLTPPLWGQGIMTEAARAVVRFGFEELALNRIFAGHFEGNHASRRVQKKLGFRYEGVLRQDVVKDGRPVDHVMMALLREEFEDAGA
jgi:RimJ/RimL family protein N-acetyltransferase